MLRFHLPLIEPEGTYFVAGELQGFEVRVADVDADFIGCLEGCRRDPQSRLGRRAANESQQDRQRAQHIAGPSGGDLAEQPVSDRIPLGSSRRVMAHRDLQAAVVREVL